MHNSNMDPDNIGSLNRSYDIFMQSPVTIGIVRGYDYVIELANENLLEVWGRTADVIGKPMFEAIPELNGQGYRELLDDVMRTGKSFHAYEFPITLVRNGREEQLFFDFVYKPFYENGSKDASGVMAVGHDVTEKVHARNDQLLLEENLRKSEQRYRQLFQNSPIAKWEEDFSGVKERITELLNKGVTDVRTYFDQHPEELFSIIDTVEIRDVNEAALELWGGTKEDLVKGLKQFLNKDTIPTFIDELVMIAAGGGRMEKEIVIQNKRGEYDNVLLRIDFPYTNDYSSIPVILVNITERKKTEEALRDSEVRFRTLAEALPQMVWIRDLKGNIEYGSRRWEEYSGIAGISQAWKAMVHPDDWSRVMEAWQKDSVTGHPFRYEVRLKNWQGEYRWHYASGEPIRNKEGKIIKWTGALTDIHTQKTFSEKLEKEVASRTNALKESEQKLEQIIKELERSNEDLQQFAHVASHDLKEPVRKVLTFCHRLKDELGKELSDKAANYLLKIESASLRMYSMIDGVLLYSSMDALEQTREVIDLEEIMQNIEEDLEVGIQQKGATITYKDLPAIEGSPILIYQLFYNLIGNSLKFSRAGEPLKININREAVPKEEAVQLDLNPAQQYIRIKVHDNGIGFNQDYGERIFQTFTRLNAKDKYEGTGLGLSLCRKIVERHGGKIYAEGKEGEGAAFYVVLPV